MEGVMPFGNPGGYGRRKGGGSSGHRGQQRRPPAARSGLVAELQRVLARHGVQGSLGGRKSAGRGGGQAGRSRGGDVNPYGAFPDDPGQDDPFYARRVGWRK